MKPLKPKDIKRFLKKVENVVEKIKSYEEYWIKKKLDISIILDELNIENEERESVEKYIRKCSGRKKYITRHAFFFYLQNYNGMSDNLEKQLINAIENINEVLYGTEKYSMKSL